MKPWNCATWHPFYKFHLKLFRHKNRRNTDFGIYRCKEKLAISHQFDLIRVIKHKQLRVASSFLHSF
ncbi:hypothetical protein SAMN05216562_0606 [Microbulbifer marinus]|uniref:Uncharacterized protein n=1 Tax=Microbulbifer marinus TaxID=658218 RepID=A0A1H3W8W6_9GAMM|nr:hypothetical protein SAMN05216562_0606 [Microbulbifer marinus]